MCRVRQLKCYQPHTGISANPEIKVVDIIGKKYSIVQKGHYSIYIQLFPEKKTELNFNE